MKFSDLWKKESRIAGWIDKGLELIEKHPKKAISIAVLITSAVAPQYQHIVDKVAQLLVDQSTPGIVQPAEIQEVK